jgi:hypothetical protein
MRVEEGKKRTSLNSITTTSQQPAASSHTLRCGSRRSTETNGAVAEGLPEVEGREEATEGAREREGKKKVAQARKPTTTAINSQRNVRQSEGERWKPRTALPFVSPGSVFCSFFFFF